MNCELALTGGGRRGLEGRGREALTNAARPVMLRLCVLNV